MNCNQNYQKDSIAAIIQSFVCDLLLQFTEVTRSFEFYFGQGHFFVLFTKKDHNWDDDLTCCYLDEGISIGDGSQQVFGVVVIGDLFLELLLWDDWKLKLVYHETVLHGEGPEDFEIHVGLFLYFEHELLFVLNGGSTYCWTIALVFF